MTSPSAQWRALESADAGTTPLSRRPRLLSKRGVTSTRCHKTAIDVTIDRLKLNSLAQYSVGVPRSRLAQARRRRRPSTRSQRLRRPARRRGRADRPATHSPPQYTWTKPACPHCAPASPSSKVEVWGGLLVPADSAEMGTPQGRRRQAPAADTPARIAYEPVLLSGVPIGVNEAQRRRESTRRR
jgi:hypothetical protein